MLKPMLGNKAGRIEFLGTCNPDDPTELPELPRPLAVGATKNGAQNSSLKDVFRFEKQVRVQETRTTIRIVIGDVPRPILQTNFEVLQFNSTERTTPDLVLWRIMDSAEVALKGRKVGFERITPPFRRAFLREPADGLPSFPSRIEKVTLDDALTLLATTFHGIVIYGACSTPPRYAVEFVQLPDK